ncbi:MAG: DegV family protein [Bacillota bacterium]
MANVKVFTDSTAYLTDEDKEQLGITVVPLVITFQNSSYKERVEIKDEDFYKALAEKGGFPTTSQPSAGDFAKAYQENANEGDEIISIHISSAISGTYASAISAAGMLPNYNISVFDSFTTAVGLRYLVTEAAKMAQIGVGKEDILKALNFMRDRVHILFMVDTLEYLRRGGRIGGAQALIGSLLQVKPILTIRGKIEVFDKVRTRQKALARMTEEFKKFYSSHDHSKIRASILHVNSPGTCDDLAQLIKGDIPDLQLEKISVGPVIGAHVGPGTLGVAYCLLP